LGFGQTGPFKHQFKGQVYQSPYPYPIGQKSDPVKVSPNLFAEVIIIAYFQGIIITYLSSMDKKSLLS